MDSRRFLLPILPVLAIGCQKVPGAQTVVILTYDATSARILLGNDDLAWNVSPNLLSFFAESSVFYQTMAPRGLTSPSLATMLTGEYPLDNGVRENTGVNPTVPTLLDRFHDAGFHTVGYLANECHFIENDNIDDPLCTQWEEGDGELEGTIQDGTLVDAYGPAIQALSPNDHLATWIHFIEPHRPYQVIDDYYTEFHPEPYTGDLVAEDTNQVDTITLGQRGYDAADRTYLEAAYASQVKSADLHFGQVMQALKDAGRYDDAYIVFGIDHGQELAGHNLYFWHGCSPYNDVLRVVYAFHGPDVPAGSFQEWISVADVAPTLAELAGAFDMDDVKGGTSLVQTIQTGVETPHPVFFERGPETMGVQSDGWKYILSSTGSYDACPPFDTNDATYPGEYEELYDITADPDEQVNGLSDHPDEREALRALLCDRIERYETPAVDPGLMSTCQATAR